MNRDTLAAIAAIVAVVAVAILGFRFLGSPGSQRLIQSDRRVLQALNQLALDIQEKFRNSKEELPANLDSFPNSVKQNPFTHKPFVYKPKSKSAYDLCATFSARSPEAPPQPHTVQPNEDRWHHPAGDFCFPLDATQLVPPAPYDE